MHPLSKAKVPGHRPHHGVRSWVELVLGVHGASALKPALDGLRRAATQVAEAVRVVPLRHGECMASDRALLCMHTHPQGVLAG